MNTLQTTTSQTSSWEIYYKNTNDQLTENFYNLLKQYENDNFNLKCPIVRLKDESAQVGFRGKLSNVDVILLFRRIFQENREYMEGCIRFEASSTLTVVENIDMKPLLEIF